MKIKSSQIPTLVGLALVVTLFAAGCQHPSYSRSTATTSPQKPPPTAAVAPKVACSEAAWGLIRLSKTMPAEVTLSNEFVSELTLTAQGCSANVVVRDTVPTGASYLRNEPAAMVEGNELTWKLGLMDAAQIIKTKVWLKADKEGTLTSCATVTADPRVCAAVFVGKPILSIENTGPETAILGTEVTYNIVVKNIGTSAARNVMVGDPVPAGMSHSTGKSDIIFEVGDLAPGQAKPLAVTLKANQRGKICNTATATSSNTAKVSKETCTVILVPGLKVEKSGTKEQILGRNADYEITVSNTGDTILNNVVISDVSPEDCSIVAAPGANISGNKATWTVAELKTGAKMTQTIKLTSNSAGTSCNTVTASVGTLSDSAKSCTLWRGIPAVAFEVIDDPDPIQIGESTTYTIKVTNQGFADIHNVKVVASFGEQVIPISSPQGRVSGKNVNFPTVAAIAAKQSVTYTITVKGASAGDSRNKVVLTCDELKSPVDKEESTNVY